MAKTREQIVQSAAELIWQQGYTNTSVDQIIESVGVSKGNFYYHFSSKEELGLAALDAWVAAYDEALFEPAFASGGSPLAVLERFVDDTVRSQQENGNRGCPLGRMALEMGDLCEAFRVRLDGAFEGWRLRLSALMEKAGMSVRDAADFSRYLLATIQGGFLLTKVERDGEVLAGIARELKRQLRERLPVSAA